MKKMMMTLIVLLTTAVSANAMSYEQARNEALFLTDKMAYELNLTDAQYEAAYEINLDYLMGVTGSSDVFGLYWERRNLDLSYILYSWQWEAFRAASYFYRPLYWDAGFWHFAVYARYPRRDYFYFGRPHFYASYRGGHSWRMNGGRSYYEGRHTYFRPDRPRDQHFGMRNSYDRGDFRSGRGGSSTRFTEHNGRNGRNDRSDRRLDNSRRGGNFSGSRSSESSRQSGNFSGSRSSESSRSSHFSGSRSDHRPMSTSPMGRGSSVSRGSSSGSVSRSSGGSVGRSSGGSVGRSSGGSVSRGSSSGGATRSSSSGSHGGNTGSRR